ncbi:substrate-binding domain-containing protein [Anaerofilum sp. BX8]|uniref:Substrate-binding domain-containing protein n=1 Tax=Anaerofilum hominis TaxID=2763016 RepID=A0A923L183_9FIRM|nr:substrate-binding domain-containing protein [Anaerofilum hominis]MBC5581825.1 substrate-binding domain-containing protein [Anaerofilum hominis]
MKKALAILMAAAMALSLVACGGSDSSAPVSSGTAPSTASTASTAGSGETYKIYMISMDQMDQHWVNMDKGCQKAVEELGNVEYKWSAPDVKDDAKQIECINNAVADGADAILLAANGPDADVAALKEAQAAGVKIVYVDSPANLAAVKTFATNNEAAGKTAGEQLLKALTDKGVESGKIGIINTNAATTSTVDRENGFRSAFEGTGFEILETQYSEGDAAKSKDIATNYIAQGCVGIFGTNEGTTVGTGNAIKEDGGDVIGVGFDKSDTILGLIKDGSILCAMAQNPDVMGYEGIKAAVAALDGSDAGDGSTSDTGVTVLTKDNI